MDNLTDIQLIESDTDEANEILLRRYVPLVKATVNKYRSENISRDDLLQEGFIGLFKAIKAYDAKKSNSESLAAFAKTCVENQLKNASKRQSSEKNKMLDNATDIDDLEKSNTITLEDVLFKKEELFELAIKAQELSGLEKEVFGYLIEGYNYQEIATRLGKSAKSIDNTIQRIRSKLK